MIHNHRYATLARLYVIGPSNGPYKIGISHVPRERLKTMQVGCWEELKLHHECESPNAEALECAVHWELNRHRLRGEWFGCELDHIVATITEQNAEDTYEQPEVVYPDHKPGSASHARRLKAALDYCARAKEALEA